ncbi:MAG TPA: DsbE family thiol:disulfide interchange protein [Xanthobacteraceae bacterium]|nr:DsbE family thiol:disulfide interchange protein [Xanthobacteraceae bacterium]
MSSTETTDATAARRRKLFAYVPLAIFLGLAFLFLLRLGAGDISRVPSALIGRPVPQTVLAPLPGLDRDGKPVPGINPADFTGAVTVLNVWASWCIPCHTEAPLLLKLAADKRIRVVGINQADQPDNARRFLGRHGNPFVAVGIDPNRRASIEWGVYGVPETFVVGRDGRIAYKLIGEVTERNLETTLKPQIEKALAAATPSS